MYKFARSRLSKLKFRSGLDPKVMKKGIKGKIIPEPFKSAVLFYADFELAWAWRYSREFSEKKDKIKELAIQERSNVPEILKLCDIYDIPVTWATVGHLFLESCGIEDGVPHPDIIRNKYFENEYWKFGEGDWFDDDPCGNYSENPDWYCPDLINKILAAKVKHEIGCHTFSHIDCRDGICPYEVFESEINKCRELAERFGVNLKSFVHPGHTIGNLKSLSALGFSSYRTDYGNVLGFPVKSSNGLWEIKGTMEISYRKKWDLEFNVEFYKIIIERAIKNNLLCVFWFHPSFDRICIEKIMPELFSYIHSKRNEITVMTVSSYLDEISADI